MSYNKAMRMKVTYKNRVFSLAIKHAQVSDDWLVFLHGIGCAKECFDPVFETELAKQYSILTFDFIGFGDSDKPDDFEYTLEQHADIAFELIEQFKPKTVSLVAHSMGGTIGLLLAQKLDNLDWFLNLEGNLVSEDAGIVSRRTSEQSEADFVNSGHAAFLTSLKQADDPAFRTWAEWYENSSKIAIYRSGTSLVEWSDSGKLMNYFSSLNKKAFVHGDQTEISHLTSSLKNIKTISISNSGHFMMLDNPVILYKVIAKLLT